jgi:thiol-disulfide isomerase/thioredoxin
MKKKTIMVVGTIVLVILLVILISFFFFIDETGGLGSKETNFQTNHESSICIIDTECDVESAAENEITGNTTIQNANTDNTVIMYFFWGDGCPHCAEQKPFIDSLRQKYPTLEVKMFETWYNKENAERFQQMAESFGTSAQGVPTTFIGDKYWVGFAEYMKPEMEDYIEYCLENGCTNRR